jgi:hypothetical protein
MGKLIKAFKDTEEESKEDMLNRLDEIRKDIENGEITNLMIAGRMADGNVLTGWANCDLIERQNLIGHVQIDIMWGVVRVNLPDILERI